MFDFLWKSVLVLYLGQSPFLRGPLIGQSDSYEPFLQVVFSEGKLSFVSWGNLGFFPLLTASECLGALKTFLSNKKLDSGVVIWQFSAW